ncbi:MAG: 2OG-Fe(II) oxygenase [Kiloniellales bacterium]|nr:2OG-Fe(II) oxygenase [Kiloniellales bacterium]
MASLSTAAVCSAESEAKVFDFAALEAASLQHDPFDFLVVPHFLTPLALAAANRDFPRITGPGNLSPESLTYGAGFRRLLEGLEGREFAERLGQKFGLDIADSPTTLTIRAYSEASDGNIHTDHRSKIITVLVYFNTNWSHQGGRLRLLGSKTDIEDYAAEVPPIGGTLVAFRREDHSFHGYKRFVGERRAIQMSWLHQSRSAQYKQRFDRFCTRSIKRFLRMI